MRRGRIVLAYAAAFVLSAASAGASVVDAIDSMGSEADECGLLVALCKIASRSAARAESVPSSADLLATRQALNADARIDEAVDAARAIERKHGRRLACLDDDACAGIVPKPRPAR
jgi:hypothetical protein